MQNTLILAVLAACCAAPPAWAALRSRSVQARLGWAAMALVLAAWVAWSADPLGLALGWVDGRLSGAACGF